MKNLPVTSGARQDEEVPKSRRADAGREAIKLMGDGYKMYFPSWIFKRESVSPTVLAGQGERMRVGWKER